MTAIIHFINDNPIDRYSEAQSKFEMTTRMLEFVAAQTVAEQMTYLFGDIGSLWNNLMSQFPINQ